MWTDLYVDANEEREEKEKKSTTSGKGTIFVSAGKRLKGMDLHHNKEVVSHLKTATGYVVGKYSQTKSRQKNNP